MSATDKQLEDSLMDELNDIDAEELLMASLAKKKKKKVKKVVAETPEESTEVSAPESSSSNIPATTEYAYIELLDRAFKLIQATNPRQDKTRGVIPHPVLTRSNGARKTIWTNFKPTVDILHRSPEHMISFVTAELLTEASLDSSQQLVIKGKYVAKQIESLIKKYIQEYVACGMCHNPETTLSKDAVTRLYFMDCAACGSKRSVASIKSGFHATLRADRRQARTRI